MAWRITIFGDCCGSEIWGSVGKLDYGVSGRPHGCSLWKGIRACWDNFSILVSFTVGGLNFGDVVW